MRVFIELLLSVNYEPSWFRGEKIDIGSTAMSISSIQESTGLSRAIVVKALKILEKTGEISRKKFKFGIVTKINKFSEFQCGFDVGSSKNELPTELPTEPVSELPSEPPSEPPSELLKEIKNKRNKEDIKEKKYKRKEKPDGFLFSPPPKATKVKVDDFVPPTLKEVEACFRQSAAQLPTWQDEAKIFFYHYDGLGWRNTHGVKIRNWDSFANKWIFDKINENKRRTNRQSDKRTTTAVDPDCGLIEPPSSM